MTALFILFLIISSAWDIVMASVVKTEQALGSLSIILISLDTTAAPTPVSNLDPLV